MAASSAFPPRGHALAECSRLAQPGRIVSVFDPYRKWLGIPNWEQPPNHYRLLGINLFENDPDVIETATDRQMGHIRNYQAGKHSELSQRLLNELSAARLCLLTAEKKKAYDTKLQTELAAGYGDAVIPGPPFGFYVRGAVKYFGVAARQFWLSRFVLPRAHAALGQDIVGRNRYRDRMPDLYARLEDVTQRLAALQPAKAPATTQSAEAAETHPKTPENIPTPPPATAETPPKHPEPSPPPPPPTAEGPEQPADLQPPAASEPAEQPSVLKRAMRRVTNASRATYLSGRRKAILREMARTAWSIDYERAGPANLTTAVRNALTGLEECRAEVKTLSEVPPGQVLSPKRLAWIVLGTVGLVAMLFLLLRWML